MKKKTLKGNLNLKKHTVSNLSSGVRGGQTTIHGSGNSYCICGPRESIHTCYSDNNRSCDIPCTGF